MFVIRRIIVITAAWFTALVLALAKGFGWSPKFDVGGFLVITVGIAICASADLMFHNHRRIMMHDLDQRESGLRQVR